MIPLLSAGRYLGDNPEWEFIVEDKSLVLPFKEHRDVYAKQRVSCESCHRIGRVSPVLPTRAGRVEPSS